VSQIRLLRTLLQKHLDIVQNFVIINYITLLATT